MAHYIRIILVLGLRPSLVSRKALERTTVVATSPANNGRLLSVAVSTSIEFIVVVVPIAPAGLH